MTAFAVCALTIILLRGDQQAEKKILELSTHILTAVFGACLGLIGERVAQGR